MNDSERTPSKQAKLKLKSFHKRQMFVKAIKNLFDFKYVKQKSYKGSGSGGNGEKYGSFTYNIETIKKYWCKLFGWRKIGGSRQFNKQQLPGKLILIHKKYYRIC